MNNNDFYIKNNALQPDNSKKGKNKVLPILILVLLVGVAGFLVYELKFKKDDTKKSDEYVEYDPNYSLEDGQNKNEQEDNDGSDDLIDVENPESDDNSKSNSSPGNILSNIVSNTNKDSNNQTSNVPGVTKTIPVTGIKLNVSNLTMTKNGNTRLTATITPSNATNKGVTWKSSNSSIVSVDQSGKVIAKNYGTATITVTSKDGNKKASVTIKVPRPSVKSIAINSSGNLYVGHSLNASIKYNPSDASDMSVTWESSDTSIATVSSTGKITGISSGTVTITATSKNGKKATKSYSVQHYAGDYSIIMKPYYAYGGGKNPTYNILVGYNFDVYKNGAMISSYVSINYNGYTHSPGSLIYNEKIDKSKTTASITLIDRDKKPVVSGVKVTYEK